MWAHREMRKCCLEHACLQPQPQRVQMAVSAPCSPVPQVCWQSKAYLALFARLLAVQAQCDSCRGTCV